MRQFIIVGTVIIAGVLAGGCPQSGAPSGGSSDVGRTTDSSLIDSDGDGLSDAEEQTIGTFLFAPDSDLDGLTDSQEVSLGTDPTKLDTDGDLISDAEETALGLDPLVADSVGFVRDVFCNGFAAVDIPSDGYHGVVAADGTANFSTWAATDRVVHVGGALINADALSRVSVTLLGEDRSRSRIEQPLTAAGEIALRDTGAAGIFGLDVYGVPVPGDQLRTALWVIGERILVVTPCDNSPTWFLVNVDRCQAVGAEPASLNFKSPLCGG